MVAPASVLPLWPRRLRRLAGVGPVPLLLALLMLLPGCSPIGMAVGAGAAVGVQASQARGLGTAISDDLIWTKVQARWLDTDANMFRKLQLQVHEGRALISGVVQTPAMRLTAVRLAWEVDGVKQVIDEIKVAEAPDLGQDVEDEWIVQKLWATLLFDKAVRSVNYSIDAVEGTIYLMGIAQDQAELQRVIDHARDIAYVRKVVSFVRIKGEAPPPAPEPSVPEPPVPEPSGPGQTEPAAASPSAMPPAPGTAAPGLPTKTAAAS